MSEYAIGAMPPGEFFSVAIRRLDAALDRAVHVSDASIGIEHTGRQNRVLFTFSKLIAHGMSMQCLLHHYLHLPKDAQLLDYFSLGVLSRTAIDASLMTVYMSDINLSVETWNLRRNVMYLHDLTNRARFLRSASKNKVQEDQIPFFNGYEENKAKLKKRIGELAAALRVPKSRADELKAGNLVFVDGARGAVREAGWSVDDYDFHQSYLSAYVHSHPVSFMRADEHEISFEKPSAFQLGFSGFVTDITAAYLENVTNRVALFCKDFSSDPLGQVD